MYSKRSRVFWPIVWRVPLKNISQTINAYMFFGGRVRMYIWGDKKGWLRVKNWSPWTLLGCPSPPHPAIAIAVGLRGEVFLPCVVACRNLWHDCIQYNIVLHWFVTNFSCISVALRVEVYPPNPHQQNRDPLLEGLGLNSMPFFSVTRRSRSDVCHSVSQWVSGR